MNVMMLDRAVRDIHDRGFASFSCADASKELRTVISGFEALLSLADARAAFTIPTHLWARDELGEPFELGLIEKSGKEKDESAGFFDVASGRTRDDPKKTLLHYSPKLLQYLTPKTRIDFSGFLEALETLNFAAIAMVNEIVTEFESPNRAWRRLYPFAMAERMQRATGITRLIRYEQGEKETAAQVHRDRCGFTVHRYASRRGLVLFGKTGSPHRVSETDPSSVAVFTGEKFPAMTGNAFGLGVPHGVREDAEAAIVLAKPRYTVVTFVHLPLYPSEVRWLSEHRELLMIDRTRFSL